MKKTRDLLLILLIYALAFIVGILASVTITHTVLKFFVFDTVATVVTFLFSVALKNSSVYDAYWSLTPMFISIWLFISEKSFSTWQLAFLAVFNIWSARLTVNWITVFTDFSYEDWRYKKFRNETPKPLWPLVNFFGIHYVPTVFVFLGMLPVFEISNHRLGVLSVPGMAIILLGVAFELLSDINMHKHLSSDAKGSVCKVGLWKYSRHPNYLGEITVWLGVYLTMLPYSLHRWYYAIGFIGMIFMFNVISIPLMEKRQLSRRPEYAEYRNTTSRLLLLPRKR